MRRSDGKRGFSLRPALLLADEPGIWFLISYHQDGVQPPSRYPIQVHSLQHQPAQFPRELFFDLPFFLLAVILCVGKNLSAGLGNYLQVFKCDLNRFSRFGEDNRLNTIG